MSETTPSQSLEETLNKTDLGHIIYEKRFLIGGALIAILVGVITWLSISGIKLSQEKKGSQIVFQFQNEVWEKVKGEELSIDVLVSRFHALEDVAKSSAAILPLALEISKYLSEKELHNEALKIIEDVKVSNDLSKFFTTYQRAILLEKADKKEEAILVIQNSKNAKEVLMPAYLELLLGKLQMSLKKNDEAKTTFESIVNNYPNDEEAKLAKLYLSEIK